MGKYEKLGVLLVDKDGEVSVQLFEDPVKGLDMFENWEVTDDSLRATFVSLYFGDRVQAAILVKELSQGDVRETAWRLGFGPIDLKKAKFWECPFRWIWKRIFRGIRI